MDILGITQVFQERKYFIKIILVYNLTLINQIGMVINLKDLNYMDPNMKILGRRCNINIKDFKGIYPKPKKK